VSLASKPMRAVFGEELVELGKTREDLVVLDADVSSSTQTAMFGNMYPTRFINCGIAEANMVSVAAGLAASGFRPVASTFAFLLATRAADQIRSQVAYSRLPVVLAGGYAGLSDFADGGSHQSVMDLSTFLNMPNMTVICPGSIEETQWAVRTALSIDGPVYLRLSRAEVGSIPLEAGVSIGRTVVRRQGRDLALITTGQTLGLAVEAAEALTAAGISVRLLDLLVAKPLDEQAILAAARECGAIVTVEENSVRGGLGSMIAAFLSGSSHVPVGIVGINDSFGQSGPYESLRECYGLTVPHIVSAAKEAVEVKEKRR
jgi:transketolase